MWHEYPIPTNYEKQKEIIRKLRTWIEGLEEEKLITGFAFNHYYSIPSRLKYPNELRVRFEYANEENSENSEGVEKQLELKIRQFLSDYVLKQRIWNNGKTPEYVLRAYEFGSRCAFLFWRLSEEGRFEEDLTSTFYPFRVADDKSLKSTNFSAFFQSWHNELIRYFKNSR